MFFIQNNFREALNFGAMHQYTVLVWSLTGLVLVVRSLAGTVTVPSRAGH